MIPSEREAAQDGDTIEYAVQCQEGPIHWNGPDDGITSAADGEEMRRYADEQRPYASCGPHRVVQRLVGPWTAVPEDTE